MITVTAALVEVLERTVASSDLAFTSRKSCDIRWLRVLQGRAREVSARPRSVV